ncbi:hypothetical protein RJT34_23324 [Clitoria ternatea]|uniref:Uncharacterized protein n=1 Tax=Clitoria ternatea TaxID=43366 RepID=A0AAN9FUE9_CLITE
MQKLVRLGSFDGNDRLSMALKLSWDENLRISDFDHASSFLVIILLSKWVFVPHPKDVIMDGLKESCTAKMIQKTAYSSPHSGQAFVIFRRKETAELVVRRLEEGSFLMSNGRYVLYST